MEKLDHALNTKYLLAKLRQFRHCNGQKDKEDVFIIVTVRRISLICVLIK